MAFVAGLVAVGTAAVAVCTPSQRGALIAKSGTTPIWLGGSAVAPGNGYLLPAGSQPVTVLGAPVISSGVSDALYAAQPGTAGGSVSFLAAWG